MSILQWTVMFWALTGLCLAGHRPLEGETRPRYTRHHDRWTQWIQYPALHNQGTQEIEYPSLNDQNTGQAIQYPYATDSAASAQIKVNI